MGNGNQETATDNAATMREAVVLALSLLDLKDGVPYKTVSQKDIDFMKAALSAPPRNCDVGTAEEQWERWKRFCIYRNAPMSQNRSCDGCMVYDALHDCKSTCELVWAQMPYEEGDAK